MARKPGFLVKKIGKPWMRLSAQEFPKAVRATYQRGRTKLWGKRRRWWREPPPVRPPPPPKIKRVSVGFSGSIEGRRLSLTYQEWVPEDEVEEARSRGEKWVKEQVADHFGPAYGPGGRWEDYTQELIDSATPNSGVDGTSKPDDVGLRERVLNGLLWQKVVKGEKRVFRQLVFGEEGEIT